MLSFLAACIIAISSHPTEWPQRVLEAHERGHCACPMWKHPETALLSSELLPPAGCQFRGEVHIVRFPEDKIRRICLGREACQVRPDVTLAQFEVWASLQ